MVAILTQSRQGQRINAESGLELGTGGKIMAPRGSSARRPKAQKRDDRPTMPYSGGALLSLGPPSSGAASSSIGGSSSSTEGNPSAVRQASSYPSLAFMRSSSVG